MINFASFIAQNSVRIPMLQRDYVQGADCNADKRNKFINNLLDALHSNKPIKLDFIYGSSVSGTTHFVPIDGQQRLTTLVLLGYMLGSHLDTNPLCNTTIEYHVRVSTGQFITHLLAEKLPTAVLSGDSKISEYLPTVPSWYAEHWSRDASVQAMLQMLDALKVALTKYSEADIKRMAQLFFDPLLCPVSFELLDMGVENLTDDLYVKMNARGKQLTPFENWKAEFYGFLKAQRYTKEAKEFSFKIEDRWIQPLWNHAINTCGEDEYPRYDEMFMRVYTLICQVLYYGSTRRNKTVDQLLRLDKSEIFDSAQKVQTLFHVLDLMAVFEKHKGRTDRLLSRILCTEYNPTDLRVCINADTDLFQRLISGQSLTAAEGALLVGLARAYGKTNNMQELARALWGAIRSRTERRIGKNISANSSNQDKSTTFAVLSDFHLTEHHIAYQCTEQLTAQLDVYAALSSAAHTNLAQEKTKASYRGTPKHNTIKRLSNHPYLSGNLTNVYAAVNADPTDASAVADRLDALLAMSTDAHRQRCLIGHGMEGIRSGNRIFIGCTKESNIHWQCIFTADASNPDEASVTSAIHAYLTGQAPAPPAHGWLYYAYTYPQFLEAIPNGVIHRHYDHYYCLTALKNMRTLMGYNNCPYAYTVLKHLGLSGQEVEQYCADSTPGWLHLRFCGLRMQPTPQGWVVEYSTSAADGVSHPFTRRTFPSHIHISPGKDHIQTAVTFVQSLYTAHHALQHVAQLQGFV